MINRREFLRRSSMVLLTTPFFLTGMAEQSESNPGCTVEIDPTADPYSVFDLSVASGDPTPQGVILWTHIQPEARQPDLALAFEVARDAEFTDLVMSGVVPADHVSDNNDFTIKLDLDGHLEANHTYFYRFIYGSVVSRTGRCRTLPEPGVDLESIEFGVVTCQDFSNGYYGAFSHLAQEEIHFVICLGDFIYESQVTDSQFGRNILLPSAGSAALTLADYRYLYRTYRSDRALQAAMERHTWMVIWDDHETANDCYWDYLRDTLGAPDHPFTVDPVYGNDANLLRQLRMDAMTAWSEYVPARLKINHQATHPHQFFDIYRSFQFGDLVNLVMTDDRSYRSAHPCGEQTLGQRYASLGCAEQRDTDRTMLGETQRDWFLARMAGSEQIWNLWANQVLLAKLDLGKLHVNLDAWDGYEFERYQLMTTLKSAGVKNLITLTGDLHAYMAGYMKIKYERDPFNLVQNNLVGVELMTPSITSLNVGDALANAGIQLDTDAFEQALVTTSNPYIRYFNANYFGYSLVRFTREECIHTTYSVDKSVPSDEALKQLLIQIRVPREQIKIEALEINQPV